MLFMNKPTLLKLIDRQVAGDGLILKTTHGQIRLQAAGPSIMRVTYTLADDFSATPSLLVLPEGERPPLDAELPGPAAGRLVETPGADLTFSLPGISVRIDPATLSFTWFDRNDRLLTREPARGGKTLDPFTLQKYQYDPTDAMTVQYGADGLKVRATEGRPVADRVSYHTKLEFEWQDGEALYGLGSHEDGVMNLRGTMQYLYQQNMKVVIPFLVSTRGYGVLWDSCSAMKFRDDAFGSSVWTEADEELDYYVVAGDSLDDVVAGYRHLTGAVPMLPRWAFGYIQSKERYQTQAEILEVVAEYRRRKIPLDAIVLDWRSWVGELWGQKSFDPDRFPDPAGMIDQLHAMGVKFMISIWPIMTNNGPNQVEMTQHGFLLGNQSNYDAFNPAARAMYWKQANDGLFTHGVDAWWCDCSEPFEADWNGAVKPEPEERWRINCGEAAKYLDPEYLSVYSLLHSEGIYRGQRSVRSDKRVVNLTRSGYAGQQRWSTIVWSGDATATWETLRRQIPAALNFCAAGMPWWSTDIGAFFVGWKDDLWFWRGEYPQGCADPAYRELYLRWFQFGAFLPMFRSHGTDTPRELWRFGEPGEVVYDSLLAFIELRMRLLPYIYSVAGAVTRRHASLIKPLAFDFAQDPAIHDISDQYLFGPALMVCPVVRPLSENGGERAVRLPAGCDWYGFWDGVRYDGDQTITALAPLNSLPLYVRAGSILVLGPQSDNAEADPEAVWEIRIYPGRDAAFTVYEDSGDGYQYELGEFSEYDLSWDDRTRYLTIGVRRGGFKEMPQARQFRIRVAGAGPAPEKAEAPTMRTLVWHGQTQNLDLSQ